MCFETIWPLGRERTISTWKKTKSSQANVPCFEQLDLLALRIKNFCMKLCSCGIGFLKGRKFIHC